MSNSNKNKAAALLVIETAKRTYIHLSSSTLNPRLWDEVCSDVDVQTLIRTNISKSRSLFRKEMGPTAEDFIELAAEYRSQLSRLERHDSVQALFKAYECEKLLFEEINGAIADAAEDIIVEKLIGELSDES